MSRADHQRPRIVIVDDEAIVRESLRLSLEHAGFEATSVEDPRLAVEHIREQKPALVVLDLYMPGMDGREIARALKSDPSTRGVRIIVLTGSSEAIDVVTGLDAGAIDYVGKPIGGEALIERIRSVLHLPEGAPKPARRARAKKK
jgi:DNA-binding response OmpR family regulator